MDESNNLHNRRSRRSQVLMAASIEAAGVMLAVKLRNLSADGALVEGDQLPGVGDMVVFHKKDLRLPGHVAWISGNRAGVSFDAKLDPESVMRHVPKPRQRLMPDCKRPGIRVGGLSDAERKIGEDWVWGVPVPWLED